MARSDGGLILDWQNVIMTIGLLVVMVGGFWSLAYIPIQTNIEELKKQVAELRSSDQQHFNNDDIKFLTQKEHNEFKSNVHDADRRTSDDIKELKRHVETLRTEALTRLDAQQLLNTTRLEFLAEVKRLDQLNADNMKRKEFDVWQKEREKTISAIQERQNRFSEALDSMYSKLMQQAPSYRQP